MPLVHQAFVPFHNIWGMNSYFLNGPFDLDIEMLEAGCTSGSPVVATGQQFAGFLRLSPGRVHCEDGHVIHFEIPDGQALLHMVGGTEREQWAEYNARVEAPCPAPRMRQPFWQLPEYVTWVEQEALAHEHGGSPVDQLTDGMVHSFVERIEALDLPPGKLTIDAGWYRQSGQGLDSIDGYWQVDKNKFPDMPGLCDWIKSRGFVPALWFGLPKVSTTSPLLQQHPELFDFDVSSELKWEEVQVSTSMWFRPSPQVTDYYRTIFAPYVEMGFRKFKLDFFGGPRVHMTGLIRCAHEAIVSLNPTIEIEGHHPDIFYSRWVDSVRIHDVILHNGWDWQGLTLSHLRVAELCAPDRVINLDHGGGNIYLYSNPDVRVLPAEEDYIRHLRLYDIYDQITRYPVVSLLPDRYGPEARQALRDYLSRHQNCDVQQ